MSNTIVGPIYKKIIDAVVEASRTDFEETGVSKDVLLALQETWQQNLSNTQRANFPWDPQPVAVPAPIPSRVEAASIPSLPTPATNLQNTGNVHVKQESGYDTSYLSLPQSSAYTSGLSQPEYARQRAAVLMQQQFGSQANGSIGALQAAQMGVQGSQQRPNSPHGQAGSQQISTQQLLLQQQHQQQQQQMQRQQLLQQQQQQRLQQQQQQQQQQQRMQPAKREGPQIKQEGGSSSLGMAQTDGAADAVDEWNGVLVERNSVTDDGPRGRRAVDGMIRRHVEAQAARLEAGGLLLPLDERRPIRKKQRKIRVHGGSSKSAGPASETSAKLANGPAQYDGPDDSPLRDESIADDDAINSDLDDSEDELEGDIEMDFAGDVILCLYDKVQRVKNKWKCTLKDGVVTVDGRDYVFHKAQGEFEW